MKKEIIFALLAGSLLGFASTSFVWYKNQQKKSSPPQASSQEPSGSPSSGPSPTSDLSSQTVKLKISSPQPDELFSKDQIILEGITDPENNIVIVTDSDSYFILPDEKGNFETELELQGGLNQINISATNPAGQIQTETILVTFSTAKI